jgi:hypothetical protein
MKRAPSTEEPCAANVACTVLKASEGGDPFAEPNRDLRMMKVKQKVSGCFRTTPGARAFCRIRSYISTMKKQGHNVTAALKSVFLGTPQLPAVAG